MRSLCSLVKALVGATKYIWCLIIIGLLAQKTKFQKIPAALFALNLFTFLLSDVKLKRSKVCQTSIFLPFSQLVFVVQNLKEKYFLWKNMHQFCWLFWSLRIVRGKEFFIDTFSSNVKKKYKILLIIKTIKKKQRF